MQRVMVSLVGGGSLGGTYALIALGLVLAFRATSTLNFAHGQLMVIPAYVVGHWQSAHGGSTWPVVAVSLLIAAAAGALFYLLILQRMTGRPLFLALIATFGLAGLLDGVLALLFGPNQYPIRLAVLPRGTVSVVGAKVSASSLALTGFALALSVLVIALVRFTPLGLRVRAAGQDPVLASQGGIPVRRFYVGSWAVAAALAGLAGVIYAAQNQAAPSEASVALAAFPAILLGGLDSIEGAVIGALIIGVGQGFVATYLGGTYLNVVTYTFLLLVLLIRPQGLLGTRSVVRA